MFCQLQSTLYRSENGEGQRGLGVRRPGFVPSFDTSYETGLFPFSEFQFPSLANGHNHHFSPPYHVGLL